MAGGMGGGMIPPGMHFVPHPQMVAMAPMHRGGALPHGGSPSYSPIPGSPITNGPVPPGVLAQQMAAQQMTQQMAHVKLIQMPDGSLCLPDGTPMQPMMQLAPGVAPLSMPTQLIMRQNSGGKGGGMGQPNGMGQ